MSEQNVGILKALFEFSQRLGAKDSVNTAPTNECQMTEENRKWLETALGTIADESDPVKFMKEKLMILLAIDLNKPNTEDQSQGFCALEALNYLCEDVDHASDFIKIGGLRILIPLLASSNVQFRCLAAELIGNLSQNHSYCQEKLNELSITKVLCELLGKDVDEGVRVKALYAISCLLRENELVQKDFLQMAGLGYLIEACKSSNERLKIKTAFLLSSLLRDNQEWKSLALSLGIIDLFVSMLGAVNNQGKEHVALALSALINDCPEAIKECHRDDLMLKDMLKNRINEIQNDAQFEDELAAYREIYNKCWPEQKIDAILN